MLGAHGGERASRAVVHGSGVREVRGVRLGNPQSLQSMSRELRTRRVGEERRRRPRLGKRAAAGVARSKSREGARAKAKAALRARRIFLRSNLGDAVESVRDLSVA
jgi:hypothetical protein